MKLCMCTVSLEEASFVTLYLANNLFKKFVNNLKLPKDSFFEFEYSFKNYSNISSAKKIYKLMHNKKDLHEY